MTKSAAMGWLLLVLSAAGCASGGKQTAGQLQPLEPDEPVLMEKLRAGSKSDPAAALALADEGERRFGDSSFAEERRALAIEALINSQHIGGARSRAYQFLERYPDGPYSAHVAAMTGVHVTPAGPAAGP